MQNNNQTVGLAWHVTPGACTLSFEGNILTFTSDQAEYGEVKKLLQEGDQNGIVELMQNYKRKKAPVNADYVVKDDVVYVQDEALPRVLGDRIVEFSREQLPIQPLLNFWNRLKNNPSYRSVQNLFEFLEKNQVPVLADGRFMGYKRVRPDFKDIYSGTFDNSPGKIVKMPRNQVDDDPDVTCSKGMHSSSHSYARYQYGNSPNNPLIEVAIDPADVVAVPRDYNNSKIRCSGYEVLREIEDKEENKDKIWGYQSEDEEDDPYDDEGEEVCPDCGEYLEDCDCDCDEDEDEVY